MAEQKIWRGTRIPGTLRILQQTRTGPVYAKPNPSHFQVGCLCSSGGSLRPAVDIEVGFKAILRPPKSFGDSNSGTSLCNKWPICGGSDVRSEVRGECRRVLETRRPLAQARTIQPRKAKWFQRKGTGSSETL